jgi:hypothetical protein
MPYNIRVSGDKIRDAGGLAIQEALSWFQGQKNSFGCQLYRIQSRQSPALASAFRASEAALQQGR